MKLSLLALLASVSLTLVACEQNKPADKAKDAKPAAEAKKEEPKKEEAKAAVAAPAAEPKKEEAKPAAAPAYPSSLQVSQSKASVVLKSGPSSIARRNVP